MATDRHQLVIYGIRASFRLRRLSETKNIVKIFGLPQSAAKRNSRSTDSTSSCPTVDLSPFQHTTASCSESCAPAVENQRLLASRFLAKLACARSPTALN